MKVSDVCIVSASRTPLGNFCGAFSSLKAHELGTIVIHDVLERIKVQPGEVSAVIIGQLHPQATLSWLLYNIAQLEDATTLGCETYHLQIIPSQVDIIFEQCSVCIEPLFLKHK